MITGWFLFIWFCIAPSIVNCQVKLAEAPFYTEEDCVKAAKEQSILKYECVELPLER